MIWTFMLSGGWVMVPILLCSVLAVALLFERAWFWLVIRTHQDDALRAQLLALAPDIARAQRSGDPLCQVLWALVQSPDEPARAAGLADRIVHETRGPLPVLNTVAAVCTSLGLLGTVVGVALAFQRSVGSPQMAELAAALSVALNTTIFGLLVYVPSFIGSSLSALASNRLAFQLEQGLNTVQVRLREGTGAEVVPAVASI